MTIETRKAELAKQLLKIEDEQLLEEIQWILERPNKFNAALSSSIQLGIQQAKRGEGEIHERAKEVYKKWL